MKTDIIRKYFRISGDFHEAMYQCEKDAAMIYSIDEMTGFNTFPYIIETSVRPGVLADLFEVVKPSDFRIEVIVFPNERIKNDYLNSKKIHKKEKLS